MCETVSCTMEDVEEKRVELEQGLQPGRCRTSIAEDIAAGKR